MKEQGSKQCIDKPHIKKSKHGWWECSGTSIVGLLPTTLIANGHTKEEAYERWYGEWVRGSIRYVPIEEVFR